MFTENTIEGALYWRADTRSEELFKEGFKTRISLERDGWWKDSIRSTSPLKLSDALSNRVVCLSSSFRGATLFPYDNTEYIYVYAIALPLSKKIACDSLDLIDHNFEEIDDRDLVIDLHSLQVSEANAFINRNPCLATNSEYTSYLADTFCAYEAMSKSIKPENIIGCIKLKRYNMELNSVNVNVNNSKFVSQNRSCSLEVASEIKINSKFKNTQVFFNKNRNLIEKYLCDYSQAKMQAYDIFQNITEQKVINSANSVSGLGGKSFFSPTLDTTGSARCEEEHIIKNNI